MKEFFKKLFSVDKTPKLEIGQVWVHKNQDPFDPVEYFVQDIKGNWVQYEIFYPNLQDKVRTSKFIRSKLIYDFTYNKVLKAREVL